MEVVGEKEVSFSRWRQLVWTLMNVVMSNVTLEPRTSHAPVVSVYQRLKMLSAATLCLKKCTNFETV